MTCFSRGLAGHAHEFINANGADGAGDGNDADADDCAELIVMVVMPSLWSGDDADGNGDAGDAIRSGGGDVVCVVVPAAVIAVWCWRSGQRSAGRGGDAHATSSLAEWVLPL